MDFPIISRAHEITPTNRNVSLKTYGPIIDWLMSSAYVSGLNDTETWWLYAEAINRLNVEMPEHRWTSSLTSEEATMIERFRPDNTTVTARSLLQGIIAIITRLRFSPLPA